MDPQLLKRCEELGVDMLPAKLALLEGLAAAGAMAECDAFIAEFDWNSRHRWAICSAAAKARDMEILRRILPAQSLEHRVTVFKRLIRAPLAPAELDFVYGLVTEVSEKDPAAHVGWIQIAHASNCAGMIERAALKPFQQRTLALQAMNSDPPRPDILRLLANSGTILYDTYAVNACRGHKDLTSFFIATRMLSIDKWMELLHAISTTVWVPAKYEPPHTIGKIMTEHATAWQRPDLVRRAVKCAAVRGEGESMEILSRLPAYL